MHQLIMISYAGRHVLQNLIAMQHIAHPLRKMITKYGAKFHETPPCIKQKLAHLEEESVDKLLIT